MLAGADVGNGVAHYYRESSAMIQYVLLLNLVKVVAAIFFFGLIRSWSVIWPRWVPGLGGQPIPWGIPGVLGAIGAFLVVILVGRIVISLMLMWSGITSGWTPDEDMVPSQRFFYLACHIPLFLWPIAVTLNVLGFWQRRRPSRLR